MKTSVESLSEAVVPILREHRVVRAGVFGSRSREDHRPDSDLDLLVELPQGSSMLDLVGLEQAISDRLGIKAHVVTYNSLPRLLRDHILADEIRILS